MIIYAGIYLFIWALNFNKYSDTEDCVAFILAMPLFGRIFGWW